MTPKITLVESETAIFETLRNSKREQKARCQTYQSDTPRIFVELILKLIIKMMMISEKSFSVICNHSNHKYI